MRFKVVRTWYIEARSGVEAVMKTANGKLVHDKIAFTKISRKEGAE